MLRNGIRKVNLNNVMCRTMSGKAVLPDLPYEYDGLEPVISKQIMQLHHQKHHQTYITNFNNAMEEHEKAKENGLVSKMIALQAAIKFNGGGHVNHSIFWTNLAPVGKGGEPTGELKKAMEASFGSVETFKSEFSTMTAGVQGSGWGWLGYCPKSKSLKMTTCTNQDPLSTVGLVPLLGIDVWEHAYYLQYQNVRPNYLKEIWKVVNWHNVQERFENAIKN